MHYLSFTLTGLSLIPLGWTFVLRTGALLPTDDPFYSSPANISLYAPGDVIASRSVSTDLNGILGHSLTDLTLAGAYQFLYRTADSFENPAAAVTTLLIPHGASTEKLLSYQTAYDSANINCSPSYAFQAGANNTAIADIVMITAALNKGWYVVSSDYEGLNAAFTSGLQAGYATLDSVRAVMSSEARELTGLSASAKSVMWGYSGGSLASEWAAELQPSYAPELKFEGAALGGLIGSVNNVITTINGGLSAGLGFSGMQGLMNAYPEIASLVESSFVSQAKKQQFESIAAGCLLETIIDGAFQNLSDYFTDFDGLISSPLVQTIQNETGQMGQTGLPTMPMYIYKPINDEVSPVADTDYVYDVLCAKGAQIQYRRNLVGEHDTEDIFGSGSALEWIEDRLDGKAVSDGCTVENVFLTEVDFGTLEDFGLELLAFLENLLGGSLGLGTSG